MQNRNKFSIIIPVKPGGYVAALEHLRKILPDSLDYEILLAEGNAPSKQRNLAADAATGDILYFLDDDSLIESQNLTLCLSAMVDPLVAVVGGPSLTPVSDSLLQRLFGIALASFIGSGAVHNRYRRVGQIRETTDKELILCNMAVRRSVFVELGGFNQSLYPNEENEFLERAATSGYKLLHNPDMYIYRSQRKNLKAFVRQMFSYGRGRGEQTLITGNFSLISFIPMLFVVYLATVLIFVKYNLFLLPLLLYVCIVFSGTFFMIIRTRNLVTTLLLAIYPLMHIVNGLGLIYGLLNGKPVRLNESPITVKKNKNFGEKFA